MTKKTPSGLLEGTLYPAALRVGEGAAYIGVGEHKFAELRKAGKIRTVEVAPGCERVLRRDLDTYLNVLDSAENRLADANTMLGL